MDPQDQLANRLHSAALHLLRQVATVDATSGLSPARLSALSVIIYGGPLTMTELARAERVSPATIRRRPHCPDQGRGRLGEVARQPSHLSPLVIGQPDGLVTAWWVSVHHDDGMIARLAAVRRIATLALMVFALSGCLQLKTGLQVHENDTVSGQLVISAPKSELATSTRTVEQGFALYRAKVPPLPKGTETVYDDGTNYGTQITYTNTPLSEFNGGVKILHAGNQYTFTMQLDPNALAPVVAPGDVNTTKTFIKATGLEISITLPGAVVASQVTAPGKVIGQTTVVWNLPANIDKPTELKAVSQVSTGSPGGNDGGSGSGTSWLLIIAGIVIVLLAGAVVVLLVLRRR